MNLFPKSLERIPYLIRSIIFGVVVSIVIGVLAGIMVPFMPTEEGSGPGIMVILLGLAIFLISVAAAVYGLIGLLIPRCRNMGWSLWLLLLLLVPGANVVMQILLFVVPPAPASQLQ